MSLPADSLQHPAAGQDEGEALREVKLDLLNKFRAQATPFYWAGFTLAGDAGVPLANIVN